MILTAEESMAWEEDSIFMEWMKTLWPHPPEKRKDIILRMQSLGVIPHRMSHMLSNAFDLEAL